MMKINSEFKKAFIEERSKDYDSLCGGRNEEEAEFNCAMWGAQWIIKQCRLKVSRSLEHHHADMDGNKYWIYSEDISNAIDKLGIELNEED